MAHSHASLSSFALRRELAEATTLELVDDLLGAPAAVVHRRDVGDVSLIKIGDQHLVVIAVMIEEPQRGARVRGFAAYDQPHARAPPLGRREFSDVRVLTFDAVLVDRDTPGLVVELTDLLPHVGREIRTDHEVQPVRVAKSTTRWLCPPESMRTTS